MELLQDGKWHDYHTIVREAAKVVPPGKALRKQEQLRKAGVRGPGKHLSYTHERRAVHRSNDELIGFGARAIVGATLASSRIFEIKPRGKVLPGEKKRIRLSGKPVWRPPDG